MKPSQKTTFIFISLYIIVSFCVARLVIAIPPYSGCTQTPLCWNKKNGDLWGLKVPLRVDQLDVSCIRTQSHFLTCFFSLAYSIFFFSFNSLPPLLRFNLCATGSFPFLMGCSRFWRWPRRMKEPTAVSCPTLPGRTSVMKRGSPSPQVRCFVVFE